MGELRMCDINAYIVKEGIEEKILENVDLVVEVEDGLKLLNIFGEEKTVNARMISYNNSEKKMLFAPA